MLLVLPRPFRMHCFQLYRSAWYSCLVHMFFTILPDALHVALSQRSLVEHLPSNQEKVPGSALSEGGAGETSEHTPGLKKNRVQRLRARTGAPNLSSVRMKKILKIFRHTEGFLGLTPCSTGRHLDAAAHASPHSFGSIRFFGPGAALSGVAPAPPLLGSDPVTTWVA